MSPRSFLPRAASGDLEAQRQIVLCGLDMARECDCDPFLVLYDTLTWARIAAANGEPLDRQVLASCLCFFAQQCIAGGLEDLATSHAAEAIIVLDQLADEGSEIGADSVNQLVDNLPSHVIEMAKQFREIA